jgi:hypothetical protein
MGGSKRLSSSGVLGVARQPWSSVYDDDCCLDVEGLSLELVGLSLDIEGLSLDIEGLCRMSSGSGRDISVWRW